MAYLLVYQPKAIKDLKKLDNSVRDLLASKLQGRLENPRVPADALSGDLAGLYRIKLRKAGIRLIYRVDDETITVIVVTVGKRDKGSAYLLALKRLQ